MIPSRGQLPGGLHMTLVEGLTIAALLGGPGVAVGISLWAEDRRQDRTAKMNVLRTLMLTRISFADPQFQAAVNAVPMVFKGDQSVLAAWEAYMAAVTKPLPDYEQLKKLKGEEWNRSLGLLCEKLLLALNYPERDIAQMLRAPYSSTAFGQQQELQARALAAVVDVGSATLRMAAANEALLARLPQPTVPPAASPPPPPPERS